MLLAGDIGATTTRLGVFAASTARPAPLETRSYPTAAFANLEDMLAQFLRDVGRTGDALAGAAFGAAGPVVGQHAALTNAGWRVDAGAVARRLGIERVRLLNDLQAMAYAVPVLAGDELVTLQAGVPVPAGNAALIAPGTGLGEALLHNVGGRFIPSPSEGGHADLAPRTPREIALLQYLLGLHARADNERVLSGPGLLNLHRFTHLASPCTVVDLSGAHAPARVTASALAGSCAACSEALDLFVGLLGAEAGNVALRGMATAGVYLGGGIPPKILPALQRPVFLDAFRAKQPLQDLVAAVPVHVIVYPEPGLLGAAVAAGEAQG